MNAFVDHRTHSFFRGEGVEREVGRLGGGGGGASFGFGPFGLYDLLESASFIAVCRPKGRGPLVLQLRSSTIYLEVHQFCPEQWEVGLA